MKVMLVDDDEKCLQTLKKALEFFGYTCNAFSNPQSAIADHEKVKYDLVITDLVMPEINGIDILEKSISINPEVRVILITAFQQNGREAKKALEKKAFAFLEKPLDLGKLLEVIETARA